MEMNRDTEPLKIFMIMEYFGSPMADDKDAINKL